MGKRTASVLLVATLVGGSLAVGAPSAEALTSVESCFFSAMNRERAARGRTKLTLADDLTTIARRHSRRMAADRTIYHNRNLRNEISGNWSAAGENVGMGPSCSSIHDAFMASPGHRANIIDTDYNQAGVGVAYDEDDTVYVTEVFAGRKVSASRSRPRPVLTARARPRPPAPRPKKPMPVIQSPEPRTTSILLLLVGMDTERIDPTTGAAMGV